MSNNNNDIFEDCKKYLGLPPYNSSTNIVLYDGHHLNYMYSKYGKVAVDALLSLLRGIVYEVK